MFPIGDDTPRLRIERPYVTWGIIAVCILLFLLEVSGGAVFAQRMSLGLGVIPAVLTGAAELRPDLAIVPAWATLGTSMFLHGGVLHLFGNMLFLAIFGDNIEDAMGHGRFLLFYLLCGIAAALAHVAVAPLAGQPMIGASGAVSGVLGAYLLLYPKSWVTILVVWLPLVLPAWVLLGLWFLLQLFSAFGGGDGGVAWWAHVGGFLAGLALVVPLRYGTVPLGGGGHYPKGVRLRSRRGPRDPSKD